MLHFPSLSSYPDDNCAAAFPGSENHGPIDPQAVFSDYLNHTSGISIVAPYLNSTAFAQANEKPFIMFETNTASCGGFPGVSDSFGASMWAVDYALQMAYSNFTGALLHVGGVDDTYNVRDYDVRLAVRVLISRVCRISSPSRVRTPVCFAAFLYSS